MIAKIVYFSNVRMNCIESQLFVQMFLDCLIREEQCLMVQLHPISIYVQLG